VAQQVSLGRYFSYLVALVVSLVLFSIALLALGYDPIASLVGLVSGSFGTVFRTTQTLFLVGPLLLAALAFLVPFRARFYNIGVEGQLYIGALFGYIVAAQMGGVPGIVAIPLVLIAAMVGGTVWIALPLFMRIKLQVNEIFPTLVMNFIAVDIVNWVTAGPLKDPLTGNLQTAPLPQSTWLPSIINNTELNLGFVIALAAAFVVFFVLFRTVLGFEIRASGASPRAAKNGGVDVTRSILAVGLMSGALAGLAGMIVVTGLNHVLAQNFSPGYGYQGIAVAALGTFNPLGSVVASTLYAALSVGGDSLQRSAAAVPIQLTYALQALIVLSVLIVQKWLKDREERRR